MKAISEILFRVYLALVSIVTLFILLGFGGQLLDTGLRTYVFPNANTPRYYTNCEYDLPIKEVNEDGESVALTDEEREERCDRMEEREIEQYRAQQASEAVTALAFILVALPLFVIHFLAFYKDWKKSKK